MSGISCCTCASSAVASAPEGNRWSVALTTYSGVTDGISISVTPTVQAWFATISQDSGSLANRQV